MKLMTLLVNIIGGSITYTAVALFYGVFVVQKRIMNDISLRESFAVQKIDLVSHIELLPVEWNE